ncbi:hypothetical protein B0H14DRAFT_3034133 [Mycena olivaceomarginata]|nr:hypothetical protein B0H14DRAFT_3034133 [Mycena olivaceomarginata]
MGRQRRNLGKQCPYCPRPLRGGARQHVEACAKKDRQRRMMQARLQTRMRNKVDHRTQRAITPVATIPQPIVDELDMQVDAQPNDEAPPPSPRTSASSPAPTGAESQCSRIHIEIEYHPHSGKAPTFIPLDSTRRGESTSTRLQRQLVPIGRPPWAPFPSRADFEWAETMYMAPNAMIAKQLKGMHSNWCNTSNLKIKTVDELKMYLERTKRYVVEFREHEFEETFEGELWRFKFYYRDPWDWLLDLVSDPTLTDEIVWYPSRKYLVVDGVRQRLRDEPYNSDKLWELQSALPVVPGLPHCLLPMLAWFDKGRVSSHIRDASGNGGGELAGFMIQVQDRKDPDDRSQAEKIRFAKFKRDVYHRVMRIVFVDTLQHQASGGKCVTCADAVNRVLFPRLPILSLDGEEACICAATRAALADFPCPRCLVRHDQQHDFFSKNLEFPLRTTTTMKAVYEQAKQERFKGDAENLLQQHGLHSTENAFWSLFGSDPYDAISYDTLHADDSGKWGKHLWPLLQDTLATSGLKGMITANMAKVPRWPGLKHFPNVTTKDINDGQSWLDIEKCILPCVVQLLPRNSPLVHAIRAHLLTRMFMGLHCISDDQIKRKDKYQEEYGNFCTKLTEQYEKSFDYQKQHSLYHSTPDICDKGPHFIYCTRVNEGFHQETREIYNRLNGRDVDKQMSGLDAIREAMALIRMTLDQYDKDISEQIARLAEHADVSPEDIREVDDTPDEHHWQLGSPRNLVNSRFAMQEAIWISTSTRRSFDTNLRSFIRNTFPDEPLREDGEDIITIRPFQCIYIHYTSLEDWTDKCDVLRCNPSFQVNHEERFDCVVINMDNDPLTFGRMLYLLKCRLPSGAMEDIALVQLFKKSTWRPKTMWKNCRIFEEARTIFILPRYFVRGAHMINCFGCTKEDRTFYLDDVADSDWLLRAGN